MCSQKKKQKKNLGKIKNKKIEGFIIVAVINYNI